MSWGFLPNQKGGVTWFTQASVHWLKEEPQSVMYKGRNDLRIEVWDTNP